MASHKSPKSIQKALFVPGTSPLVKQTSKAKPAVKRTAGKATKGTQQPQSGPSNTTTAITGLEPTAVGIVGNLNFSTEESSSKSTPESASKGVAPGLLQSSVEKLPISAEKPQEVPKPPPVLPSNLPHDLLTKIQQLEEVWYSTAYTVGTESVPLDLKSVMSVTVIHWNPSNVDTLETCSV